MKLYCTPEFLAEYTRLTKNNSYSALEVEIISKLCNATAQQVASVGATTLAPLGKVLFVKKRLNGSGGFRCYLLTVVVDDEVFLGFVHPKSGTFGGDNVTDAKKKEVLEQLLAARSNKDLYCVKPDSANPKKLAFIHFSTLLPLKVVPIKKKNPIV